ncbi:MAG: radical SAM protein [Candidatus Omnitrophota bacterium]
MPKSEYKIRDKIKSEILLWKNLLIELKSYFVTFFKYGVIGNTIRIEASSMCQLKCPLCSEQIEWEKGVISKGCLKFKDFKNFVDNHHSFKKIELSNYGEIFLNPELEDIIEYACKMKVDLSAGTGVNLNTASEEILECLVKYRFKSLSVSIDGANNETYRIYRREGNFDNVISNIKKINHYKKVYKTCFPILRWQFIIFGHNEHELPIARKMAEELNMEFKPIFNVIYSYSPIRNKDFVREQIGYQSREEYEQKTHRIYNPLCDQIWRAPQINWDGKLLGCCINYWSDLGNVLESGLRNCIKGNKYVYLKKMLLGKNKAREDIPCFSCAAYKQNKVLPQNIRKMQKLILKLPLGLLETMFFLRFIFLRLVETLLMTTKSVIKVLRNFLLDSSKRRL